MLFRDAIMVLWLEHGCWSAITTPHYDPSEPTPIPTHEIVVRIVRGAAMRVLTEH